MQNAFHSELCEWNYNPNWKECFMLNKANKKIFWLDYSNQVVHTLVAASIWLTHAELREERGTFLDTFLGIES